MFASPSRRLMFRNGKNTYNHRRRSKTTQVSVRNAGWLVEGILFASRTFTPLSIFPVLIMIRPHTYHCTGLIAYCRKRSNLRLMLRSFQPLVEHPVHQNSPMENVQAVWMGQVCTPILDSTKESSTQSSTYRVKSSQLCPARAQVLAQELMTGSKLIR